MASPDLSRSLTRSCGEPKKKVTHSPNPQRLHMQPFHAIRRTTIRASLEGRRREDWDAGWCLGKMNVWEGRVTYIRLCSILWVPGALKHGKRNNVPLEDWNEGGEGEGEKEKDRVQKTDKGFMYKVLEREASGLNCRIGGEEEWEWHLKDKNVLKSTLMCGNCGWGCDRNTGISVQKNRERRKQQRGLKSTNPTGSSHYTVHLSPSYVHKMCGFNVEHSKLVIHLEIF